MVPWWTLIIAFFTGEFLGILCLALVSANGR